MLKTQALVKEYFSAQYRPYFRPPYGQRKSDSMQFFTKEGIKVALWNIDSQDWNNHLTSTEAANRVVSLMLLWRRGVILFHDIHEKAQIAVPWILNHTREAKLTWEDCRSY